MSLPKRGHHCGLNITTTVCIAAAICYCCCHHLKLPPLQSCKCYRYYVQCHRNYTVNGERFTGLNFCGFHPMKFFTGKLSWWLTLSTYACININKYSRNDFRGTLENYKKHESLA